MGKKKTLEVSSGMGWLVSFSDMITLLLAFFVMLQSFARPKDPKLLEGQTAEFRESFTDIGLPAWLVGKQDPPKGQYRQVIWPTPEQPNPEPQTVPDVHAEQVKQAFEKIRQNVMTEAADKVQQPVEVLPTSIRFAEDSSALSAEAGREIDRVADTLAPVIRSRTVEIDVVGLAVEEGSAKQQWMLSARRAGTVEARLRRALKGRVPLGESQIRCFGDGSAGPYYKRFNARINVPKHRTAIVVQVTEVRS